MLRFVPRTSLGAVSLGQPEVDVLALLGPCDERFLRSADDAGETLRFDQLGGFVTFSSARTVIRVEVWHGTRVALAGLDVSVLAQPELERVLRVLDPKLVVDGEYLLSRALGLVAWFDGPPERAFESLSLEEDSFFEGAPASGR